ncbi:hypothetical protein E5F05_18095 [Deinococcus metallilatus]|uniref:Uncharacterized protein n=1 Tax=Deinococcus metallilatus TaxID=1211322 RepID=A0AAJ5JX99_9DEIO|nr:hypothetical protein [Deinococcus metallilatus]MBB5297266.1 hypothetical protein [Deinococcus metallilatus]QBY09680.1 hypothetical protein E5F05_18095 [Deinococcus metallilatus]RXJ09052.1 hypothetical protein ERJ73_16935 [Deinococcus metallilatus]TLK21307.1 hypothetical protein FCS05_19225 [Deinococcus metallilatus]GMA17209.1 hypothetical protein GCM10025871_35400 [Deinococcus metallilatus]
MTDDRREIYNPPVDVNPSPGENGTTEGTVNDTTSLDTTLGTSRTGGMGGMAGTMDVDTDRAGTRPTSELEDL